LAEDQKTSEDNFPRICIFHDIEEDADTPIARADCARNLERMLEIEKSLGVKVTYNILGRLFADKRDVIRAANSAHGLAFHSYNHDLADLSQLEQCRNVDLRVRGYRPPKSKLTSELSDYKLTLLNFEWLASSASSLGHEDCRLENGLVKIPILMD